MGASIMAQLANYNPAGFTLGNQNAAAEVAQRRAQTALTGATADQQQIENKILQTQIKDSDVLGKAFRDAQGDPQKTAMLAIQYGISPRGFMGYRDSHLKLLKTTAELTQEQQKIEAATNEQVGAAYAALLSLPPDQRAEAAPGVAQRIQELDPEHPLPQNLADDNVLRTEIAKRNYYGKALEQQAKQAQIGASTAQAAHAAAQTARVNQQIETEKNEPKVTVVIPGTGPVRLSAQEAGQIAPYLNATKTKEPNTPWEAVWEKNKNLPLNERVTASLKEMNAYNLSNRPVNNVYASSIPGVKPTDLATTGDEYLKTLPDPFAARVKAISEGREMAPSGRAAVTGAGLQLMNSLYQYDPTFTMQRGQVRKAFTTGPDAKNIGALNTAIVHLGRLGDTAEALKTGTFTPTNELFNYFKDKFGSETVTNFGLLKDAVAGEMAAALKGTATDIEIEKMGKSIRASNSPEQMRGVIQEGMGILKDKANTYEERYKREMPDDPWSPILPSAKTMLERHKITAAGQGGGGAATATIVQHSASTGAYRHSTDGGKTWKPGKP